VTIVMTNTEPGRREAERLESELGPSIARHADTIRLDWLDVEFRQAMAVLRGMKNYYLRLIIHIGRPNGD
jgi:hypothetical protein